KVASEYLQSLSPQELVQGSFKALQGEDVSARQNATKMLAKYAPLYLEHIPHEIFIRLLPMAQDRDVLVRQSVIIFLVFSISRDQQQLPLEQVLGVFVRAVLDSDARVRRYAIRGLWQFEHAEVTSLLLNALQDPDEHVRRSAVLGLCGMETTRRMNRLYRLLNAHNELDEEHYEQIMLTLKTFQHYRYLQSQL